MTETIKVEVDSDLARRFRKRAMEKYGYKRGAVKKALEELVTNFAEQPKKPVDWSLLDGVLKGKYGTMTSVELQHALWRIKYDTHRHKHIS